MEFLESLQSKYQKYHKKNNIINHREIRLEDQRLTRIRLRNRNMDESRALSNVVLTPARVKNVTPKKVSPKIDRRTKLKIWKQERDKKKQLEKKETKPIFKVGAATNLGFPELQSFAPKKHTFKPPKNIKAIPIKNPQVQRVTRSQKPVASPPLELPRQTRKKRAPLQRQINVVEEPVFKNTELPNNVETEKSSKKRRKSRRRSTRKSLLKSDSEDTSNCQEETNLEDKENKPMITPENKPMKTPENNVVYVSPFVSTSRGKGSVKKENLSRAKRGLPSLFDNSSSPTGVAYFTTLLNNEVQHLQELCRVWNEYKDENCLSDDAKDLIDVAVGQATLLMNKKFKQFEGLIQACQTGVGADKEVTCDDLQGFWDMIYMQVDNLNTRFNRLTAMKDNNWQEFEQVTVQTKVKKRAPAKTVSKPAASSGIRAAIIAARKKKQELNPPTTAEESVFHGGFFVIKTPQKNTPSKRTPKPTPKSILKCNKKKSVVNLNKSVVFKDGGDDESVLNTTFEKTPKKKGKTQQTNIK